MNYNEAIEKLFSLHQFGIKLGLENINKLLNHIGNPEKKIKTIHVAGSNGKGSTSSFIASILMEAELKVGLYTSPHFVKFNERIRVDGNMIPDEFIIRFMNDNLHYINDESPTFFELTTAIAFLYFVEQEVDIAVIETGLGGRLDATNVLDSIVSVITSISYEHTNILGEDLRSIATEKAEIIKSHQKVFIGILPQEAVSVIEEKCKKSNSELVSLDKYLRVEKEQFLINYQNLNINTDDLPLRGIYQKYNSGLAILVCKSVLSDITDVQIKRGLKNVISNTGIQGRYERYSVKPSIIFDSAHNSEGIKVFLEEYKKESAAYDKSVLIYGAMRDKNVDEMLSLLSESFDVIYATDINYDRALSKSEIQKIGSSIGVKITPLDNVSYFIKDFRNSNSNESLVVLGSMYILGEIKKSLES